MKSSALFPIAVIAALAAATLAPAVRAETPPTKPLFELTLDLDNDGTMDRVVLVGPRDAGTANKGWSVIGQDDRVDLYIYLGAGDAPLDLSRPPTFRKDGIAIGERRNQILPLERSGKGSLLVKTGYSLFSNYADETLTIVYRNGEFLVAGLSYDFELKSGEQGQCDINFLTGKGVASKGPHGKMKPIPGHFTPVKLADWSPKSYPKACNDINN